ncbi:MAG: helix-turn-helix transcriptional regulator [Candidatus Faecousia sp.]|nr:helix-turn-helix domain-containing protein [Clostridiales bacterium]MDD6297329.1 helix-turn-helix transcriptional regulator [Bacillota bacterium]MDD7341169.1 helix-turn-helix transcriptional regulator [Bacillota bacterium]MDY2809544.1 helix-turn-helix transcriptional regulator [Candidatus Faecousia sp.]
MLNENIKNLRKSKGLSQEELAVKLNVVRQTVSKWENGLSVPDADMLIALSQVLDTPVSTLLGQTLAPAESDDLKAISEKLEVINLQLARKKTAERRFLRGLLMAVCILTVVLFVLLALLGSPYLGWDYSDPETAVFGATFHLVEYVFVRAAPFLFLGSLVGIVLTGKRDS